MALILDKTYVDESGNTNLVYIDQYGNSLSDPYLVIDSVQTDKLSKYANVSVSIYKDKNSRINKSRAILETNYQPDSEENFDAYFSVESMLNENIYQKAYEFISDIYIKWKSDE